MIKEACDTAAASGVPPCGSASDQPVSFVVPAARKLELVMNEERTRAVAILMENLPSRMAEIEACYAFGHGIWSDCNKLARRWQVWAVFADPAWAEGQVKHNASRPTGIAFAIL